MSITLDYTNMMADSIGEEYGIRETELEGLKTRTKSIHGDISNRRNHGELPFFDLPADDSTVAEMNALATVLQARFENIVVLGIGGSALGTTAIFRALKPLVYNLSSIETRDHLPRLFVLDNVDPDGFSTYLDVCDPAQTCFLVISKSGSTVEKTCQFLVARLFDSARGRGPFQCVYTGRLVAVGLCRH